jgi:inorganic pyrophosphatase
MEHWSKMDGGVLLDVVVENPLGSTVRIVYEEGRGWVETGPVFATPLPAEYGFIPETRNPADGDPADVLVIGWGPTFPGCRYQARPIGLLLRADGDHKVLAVPHTDEYISPVQDIAEVAPEILRRIEEWFRPYFELRGWRDTCWAVEWIGICRAVAAVQCPTAGQGS